jgi:uncharacterized protein (TIGR03435 family)
MGGTVTLGAICLCFAHALAAPAAFEVATIKENRSGDPRWTYQMQPGGRFTAKSVSLANLISIAYGNPYPLPASLIVNGPDWMRTTRFDVVAKADGNPAQELLPAMVRALIEERFQLRAHREARERNVLALVLARRDKSLGPSLRPTTLDCSIKRDKPPSAPGAAPDSSPQCSDRNFPGSLISQSLTMPVLARLLMVWDESRREVRDETGLQGSFEVALLWTPDRVAPLQNDAPADVARAVAGIDPNGASLNTALQEQLGLKLEPRKEPIQVLVVDRAEKPSID